MQEASQTFVRLEDLQATASTRIADLTGAEAGYVTNGAAGALVLATAACIAGKDFATMARLPDTEGIPNEVIMPRTHRTGYDHAVRTAGATIVDVGRNDRTLGTGATDVEPWEYRAAIGPQTVAIAHVYKDYGTPDLEMVVDIAHEHDLPVIVDAAAEVPPPERLSWFSDQGVDLVAFSGGKGIRGPQTTGILAGRQSLIQSVALQHLDMHAAAPVWDPPAELLGADDFDGVPPQGIGRALKVGKEELVGLLTALDEFMETDHEAERERWRRDAEVIADALDDLDGCSATVQDDGKNVSPLAVLDISEEQAGLDAVELARRLRSENPRVFVGADDAADGTLSINPMCLDGSERDYVVKRFEQHLPLRAAQ
jgi:L-seryl-tRNA(Ser) seleniumtransferase